MTVTLLRVRELLLTLPEPEFGPRGNARCLSAEKLDISTRVPDIAVKGVAHDGAWVASPCVSCGGPRRSQV